MSLKIIMTRGLPGSGKTTWAKKLIANNPGVYKRVNKDDLRNLMDAGHWTGANERFVLKTRDIIVREALIEGKHVIDDIQLCKRAPGKELWTVLVSGRNECCRNTTQAWLAEHEVSYNYLYMRPQGDMRKDAVVKKEIYDKYIKGKYNVYLVLDDRNQSVQLWRSLGLKTLQVKEMICHQI